MLTKSPAVWKDGLTLNGVGCIAKSESQNILIHTLVCRWFPVKALKLLNTHTRTDSAYTFSPQ